MKRKAGPQDGPQPKNLKMQERNITETFADPTLDVTFKMLFGDDNNKDILISLLNSLLGFVGNDEIIEVDINTNELPISFFSEEKRQSGITSAVDILCTNKGKQKIAIEMQGQKTKYFLAREQEYMAKLIAGQVKEGEGQQYDEKVLKTYIIVIGKANMFLGNTALKDQKLFEVDVQPVVIQTKEVVPGNKMFWKFFELPKFKESENYAHIDKDSSLKEQWLEFLIDCSTKQEKPDRSDIIKKGYEIMEVAKWEPDIKTLYWKQKMNEISLIETQEALKEEEYTRGEMKGKLKGEIKGEISKIKDFFDLEIPREKIIPKLKFLNDDKVKDNIESNLTYIQAHLDDSDSEICNELGLVGSLLSSEYNL